MTMPDTTPQTPGWFRRLFLCSGGWCPCEPYGDAGGCGGKCTYCGKIVAYLTHDEIRKLSDYGRG
jgi:hypothetical protein